MGLWLLREVFPSGLRSNLITESIKIVLQSIEKGKSGEVSEESCFLLDICFGLVNLWVGLVACRWARSPALENQTILPAYARGLGVLRARALIQFRPIFPSILASMRMKWHNLPSIVFSARLVQPLAFKPAIHADRCEYREPRCASCPLARSPSLTWCSVPLRSNEF